MVSGGLTALEEKQVVEILGKWDGGPLSAELFTVLARIIPQPCVETVVIRKVENKFQVLLIPRPQDDPTWPGLLHSPGQALRAADYHRQDNVPMNGVFERVQKNEIKAEFSSTPHFVGVAQYMTKRGPEAVHIFVTTLAEGSSLAPEFQWVNVDEIDTLPNFIHHQVVPIRMAVAYVAGSNHFPDL